MFYPFSLLLLDMIKMISISVLIGTFNVVVIYTLKNV